jgi:hypothetical protein
MKVLTTNWLENVSIGIILLTTIIAAVIISIVMIRTIDFISRSKCLNSDNARRWHVACEEYQNGEWIEIDPFRKNVIYYNDVEAVK